MAIRCTLTVELIRDTSVQRMHTMQQKVQADFMAEAAVLVRVPVLVQEAEEPVAARKIHIRTQRKRTQCNNFAIVTVSSMQSNVAWLTVRLKNRFPMLVMGMPNSNSELLVLEWL